MKPNMLAALAAVATVDIENPLETSKHRGARTFSNKHWKQRKKRLQMAKASRRRNR